MPDLVTDAQNPGWIQEGWGPQQNDGINVYRNADKKTSISFDLEEDSFVSVGYQLYSSAESVKVDLLSNSQAWGSIFVKPKSFEIYRKGKFFSKGKHQIDFVADCKTCELRQYHLIVEKIKPPVARETLGTGGLVWNLNSNQSAIKSKLADVNYDGKNFYLEVNTQEEIQFQIPKDKVLLLRYAAASDTGPFTMSWESSAGKGAKSLTGQKGVTIDDSWSIPAVPAPEALTLKVTCQDGAACLPVKIYKATAFGVAAPAPPLAQQIAGGLIVAVVLILAYLWLLSPKVSE